MVKNIVWHDINMALNEQPEPNQEIKPAVKQPVIFDPDIQVEYDNIKKEIITNFGEPNYNNNKPTNKSALKINSLGSALRERQRNKDQIVKFKNITKETKLTSDFSVPLPEEYLLPFSDSERKVITIYFSMPFPDHNRIAKKSGIEEGKVLRFLNGSSFQIVKRQIMESFKETLEHESLIALRQCIRSEQINAQKLNAAMAILEDCGMVKRKSDTEINIYNDSLNDPVAEKELRELGDKLVKQNNLTNNEVPN